MHSESEDSVKIDNQDEVMTEDQLRDVEKPALTSKISHRHGGNRVLSSRCELIAGANQVRKVVSSRSASDNIHEYSYHSFYMKALDDLRKCMIDRCVI
ncbi:unnamed protein product [Lasius platythorax]|uniref:Uncharacterized protein n=1 Tax=Lasius platythorax TaxID=488582 RepID=A0AAV2NZX1_9HYME